MYKLLCAALQNYGSSCGLLGQHEEGVVAYREFILLRRVLAATDSEEERYLSTVLHYIAESFPALGKYAEANTAATEALELSIMLRA